MSSGLLLGVIAGVGVAVGALLILTAVRGTPVRLGRGADWRWRELAVGASVGFVTLAVTRWIAVAVVLGVLAATWRRAFGGGMAARSTMSRLEALANWTESLRDMVATGIGLPEALLASVAGAAPAIRPKVDSLAERVRSREPIEMALRAFADECDDVSVDLVVAALLLNSNAQGRQLHAVLSALARSTRDELSMRRTVEAERRATRRGVKIVLVVTVGMAIGLEVLNPNYVAPYRTSTGQLMLTQLSACSLSASAG